MAVGWHVWPSAFQRCLSHCPVRCARGNITLPLGVENVGAPEVNGCKWQPALQSCLWIHRGSISLPSFLGRGRRQQKRHQQLTRQTHNMWKSTTEASKKAAKNVQDCFSSSLTAVSTHRNEQSGTTVASASWPQKKDHTGTVAQLSTQHTSQCPNVQVHCSIVERIQVNENLWRIM